MLLYIDWPLEGSPYSPLLQWKSLIEFQNIVYLFIVTWIQNHQPPKHDNLLVRTQICLWTNCILLPLPLKQQKCHYSKRFISLKRKFPFTHKIINFTRDYVFEMDRKVCPHHPFLPIPHRFTLKTLHNSMRFSSNCAFRLRSSAFQLISPPRDQFPWLGQFSPDGNADGSIILSFPH